MYLWLGVFWSQPHKEERFLFPAYPLICLAAAITIDSGQKLWYFLFRRYKASHYLKESSPCS
jgi:alpha-1,2-mannosyltransferase